MRKYHPLIFIMFFLILASCHGNGEEVYQGYIEGKFLYVAPTSGGPIEDVAVSEGDRVRKGDLLFRLDRTLEQAAVDEAGQRLRQARETLADLSKGARPTEIQALEAQIRQAQANLELSRDEYNRRVRLAKTGVISAEALDKARAGYQANLETVKQLQAELDTAGLGGRSDAISAARAEVAAMEAKVRQAEWSLEQKSLRAPVDALVFNALYQAGETVASGMPVISLLPPGQVKIRFFVPETIVGQLRIGQNVFVSHDGRPAPLTAAIRYISPQAEFTPPVIYSSRSRAKLVFLVEADPSETDASSLQPGLPVDVRLGMEAPGS